MKETVTPLSEGSYYYPLWKFFNDNHNPVFTVKCKGCKRKLNVFSNPLTGELTITEV